jgi:GTP-binding protein EngB required for normal cell division
MHGCGVSSADQRLQVWRLRLEGKMGHMDTEASMAAQLTNSEEEFGCLISANQIGGTVIGLFGRGSVVAIVGPNNVGTSSFLREITD